MSVLSVKPKRINGLYCAKCVNKYENEINGELSVGSKVVNNEGGCSRRSCIKFKAE